MKHQQNLTVKQIEFLRELGIKPTEYKRIKWTSTEIHLIHIKKQVLRIFERKDGEWCEKY